MAIAKDLMAAGFSAGSASSVNGQVNSAVSAAGSSQSDATALTSSINIVTTAAASTGVVLTDSQIGDEYDILNLGANPVTVYPPSGGRINQLATNAGFALQSNTAVKVRKFTATRWMGFLSA